MSALQADAKPYVQVFECMSSYTLLSAKSIQDRSKPNDKVVVADQM